MGWWFRQGLPCCPAGEACTNRRRAPCSVVLPHSAHGNFFSGQTLPWLTRPWPRPGGSLEWRSDRTPRDPTREGCSRGPLRLSAPPQIGTRVESLYLGQWPPTCRSLAGTRGNRALVNLRWKLGGLWLDWGWENVTPALDLPQRVLSHNEPTLQRSAAGATLFSPRNHSTRLYQPGLHGSHYCTHCDIFSDVNGAVRVDIP